jgi:hypothetical protein
MPVLDGPSCPGCGLPNYSGLCPVCRGDEQATRDEGLPYPWGADGRLGDAPWLSQITAELRAIAEVDPAEDYEIIADWTRGESNR